jgi:hypothetical protein
MKASESAYDHDESEEVQFASYMTGLCHDIGKYATADLLDRGDAHTLHFLGHDVIGAGVLNLLYTKEFGVSDDTWRAITTAIRLHMSGYHGTDSIKWKWMAYQSTSNYASRLLVYLRRGDLVGKLPAVQESLVTKDEPDFSDTVQSRVSLPTMYRTLNLEGGVLILLCGSSASGKTTLGINIRDQLTDAGLPATIIRRDLLLINTCFYHMGRPRSGVFADDYAMAYQYYVENNKKLSAEINAHMAKQIEWNLCERKIVVVDSVMCLYKPIRYLLGTWAQTSLQFQLLPLRNQVFTEKDIRHSHMSLDDQVRMFGDRDALCPIPSDANGELLKPTPGKVVLDVPWNGATEQVLHQYLQDIKDLYQKFPDYLLPTLDQTADMDLHQLVSYLYGRGQIEAFFRRYNYNVKWVRLPDSTGTYDILGIRYIERINHIWKYPWAVQARGAFFIVDHEQQCVYTTKQLLPRGVEVATHQQIERFRIQSTQDVHDLSSHFEVLWDTFGTTLATTLDVFRRGGYFPSNTYVSFKVDGSLVAVNLIPRHSYPRMVSILEDYLNSVSSLGQLFVTESKPYPFLAVISSNDTLVIPEVMVPYYTNAYTQRYCREANDRRTFVAGLLADAESFLQTYCERTDIVSISFEAVCPRRLDPNGRFHSELAVNYEQHHFRFLGCTRFGPTTMGSFRPHFLFSTPQWEQPLSRPIQHTDELTKLLNELESAHDDPQSFLHTYFGVDYVDEIDYEGFVLYLMDDPTTEHYSYYKAKTSTYYRLHNVKRKETIDALLSLPRAMDRVYPTLGILHGLCQEYHKLVACIQQIYDHELDECIEEVLTLLPERAQKGLKKQTSVDKRVRILVNNSDTLNYLCQKFMPRILDQIMDDTYDDYGWLIPSDKQTQIFHDWFMDMAKYGDIQNKTLDNILNQMLNGNVAYFTETI